MLSAANHLSNAMAYLVQQPLQTINQIVEGLSNDECRNLLYMCDHLDPEDDMTCAKEILKHKVMYDDNSQLFLSQLVLHLGRFDILRKVLKTNREQVERDLLNRERLPKFRVLMVKISEEITKEDLSSLKFLVGNTLPRERTENAKTFLDLTIELEKKDLVSPERVDFLENFLQNINRIDLAKKVASYKTSAGLQPQQHSSAYAAPPIMNPCHPVQQIRQTQPVCVKHRAAPVYIQQNCAIPPDWYIFNANPRGVCIIIDCVGTDGGMLEDTFKALNFNVILYKWLSVNETLSAFGQMFIQEENQNPDGLICCIISRGTHKSLLCTDTHTQGLELDKVRHLFSARVCPKLAGKPKMFFIQRYGVPEVQAHQRPLHRDEDLETDGCDRMSRLSDIPRDADVFWSHCWTDERQLEQGHHRSVYLKALTDALQKGQQRKTKLVDIHTEVNGVLFDHNHRNPEKKYCIDLKHTLRKDVIFY